MCPCHNVNQSMLIACTLCCSMFVLVPGRSVSEAFQIGNEIALAVTKMNPSPVVLKMEKVYQSCFLLTKKRYVGYSYEKPDQVKPVFDAKGIETVRRDTCPAVSKTMERSLRNYFENQDISKVNFHILLVYFIIHLSLIIS